MKRVPKIEIVASSIQLNAEGDEDRYYFWRLKGGNGEIVCWGETYTRRGDAIRSARRAKALMVEAEIK